MRNHIAAIFYFLLFACFLILMQTNLVFFLLRYHPLLSLIVIAKHFSALSNLKASDPKSLENKFFVNCQIWLLRCANTHFNNAGIWAYKICQCGKCATRSRNGGSQGKCRPWVQVHHRKIVTVSPYPSWSCYLFTMYQFYF